MKNTLSIILRVLLGLAIIAGILYYPVEQQLFSSNFYVQLFESENLYQEMTVYGLGLLMEKMGDFSMMMGGMGSGLSGMFDPNAIRDSVESLISEEWVKEQTDSATGQLIDYLNFKSPELSIVIDLSGIKKKIDGEFGISLLKKSFANLPECNMSNLMQFGMQMFSGGSIQSIPCKPPDSLMNMLSGLMEGMLGQSMDFIPDNVDLAQWMNTENLPLNQGTWSNVYFAFRWTIQNSIYIIATLLILVILFHYKEPKNLPKIIGIPTLIAGGTAGGAALYANLFSGNLAKNLLLDMVPESEFQGLLFLADVISRGFKEISQSALIFAGAVIGVGICLLLLQRFIDSRQARGQD